MFYGTLLRYNLYTVRSKNIDYIKKIENFTIQWIIQYCVKII